jgi:hypothetical protein
MCIAGGFVLIYFNYCITFLIKIFIHVLCIDILLISFNVLRHKKDVWQFNMVMVFWMSNSSKNVGTIFVGQPIAKLFINHLVPKEEEEELSMQVALQGNMI